MSIRLDERRYVEELKRLVADFRMWKNPLVPLPDGFEDDLAWRSYRVFGQTSPADIIALAVRTRDEDLVAQGEGFISDSVSMIANKVALKNGKGIFDSPVTAGIYKRVLRSQMWGPTKWGKRLLKSKDAAGGFWKMLVSEGGKAMQSGENVLSAIRHDGTGNYAANLARQGWDALGKGMHNVGHSLKNSGRAWNRFVSGWQDAKQAANAAPSNPNNTVMRDFWDGQFKRFGDWSKGHGWSIGNTIMNARTGYTDFRGIHDMKNIAAVDTHRTVWDTMNIGQHFLAYANATYDTLNTAKVVKPFVNPTADGGLQWKHSPQDYFKTLVPDPDQLWNFKTIHQAPGKLHDGSIDVVNAIRVGISDL